MAKGLFNNPKLKVATKAVLTKQAKQAKQADTSPSATQPIDGDGFARGCRLPDSIAIGIPGFKKSVAEVLPAWVAATSGPNVKDHRDLSRTVVEGQLVESRITNTDFPLRPWHHYYDWNFFVRPDPQYRNLLSEANVRSRAHPGQLECEWDSAFLPSWAWPQKGGRIWLVGRWVFDCGHPGKFGHRTEIHPPKAVASFRSEAVRLPGNRGPTRANNAVVYIGRRGGYWSSPINDMNYEFTFPLPPRPSAGAKPAFKVTPMTGPLPVEPVVTAVTAANPRQVKVVIPLKGAKPHPIEYGAIISAGWSDPNGTQAKKVIPVRIDVSKIFMDADKDPVGRDEWYVYVGVNGRWKVFESLGGKSKDLNFRVDLDLHPSDRIHVTACGFEADTIHDLMGKRTGLPRNIASHRTETAAATKAAKKVRSAFGKGLKVNENDRIGTLSVRHRADAQGTFLGRPAGSKKKHYRLEYRISRR